MQRSIKVAITLGLVVLGVRSAMAVPTLTTLATFNPATDGSYLYGGLVADAAGNLYGTTQTGGTFGFGTVYKIPAGGGPVMTLASFNGMNGNGPSAGLIADAAGNLYGTTVNGGSGSQYSDGTVFKIPETGGPITTLASIGTNGDQGPLGSLIADSAGYLYGTSCAGGASDASEVFKVPATGGAITTLASFNPNGSNGSAPSAALLADSAGNLYGTTASGGAFGFGTVFKVPASGGAITTLGSFNDTNGYGPVGDLIADAAGNLYGTTQFGGLNSDGTVFKIPEAGGPITTLATFDGTNGNEPVAGLIADAEGNLFGTTEGDGGTSFGSIFEIPAGGGPVIILATFDVTNGWGPACDLIADAEGNLYGTTLIGGNGASPAGGGSAAGTVFELSDTGFVTVPEPGTVGLMVWGGAMLLRGRRR